jgi:hypothetical protein
MKIYLITLLFIFPLLLSAQDSCQLKTTTDPFTHQTKISTGFVPFTSNGVQLSISVDATSTEIDFFLWFTKDQKCFDDGSTIQIVFEGGRLKSNFRNSVSMNCEGAFHFVFKNLANTPSPLQRLVDKKILSFHITGAGKMVTDISFSDEQQQKLQKMISCLVQNSKALVKK